MCDYENREAAMVIVRANENGKPTVWCDPCLTQLETASAWRGDLLSLCLRRS